MIDVVSERNPGYELSNLSTNECSVVNSDDNIMFISEVPGGTFEVTKNFITNDEELKKFLDIA